MIPDIMIPDTSAHVGWTDALCYCPSFLFPFFLSSLFLCRKSNLQNSDSTWDRGRTTIAMDRLKSQSALDFSNLNRPDAQNILEKWSVE